jgi:hypothetical protein
VIVGATGALTAIETEALADWGVGEDESVACTVKVECPPTEGVPLMDPI